LSTQRVLLSRKWLIALDLNTRLTLESTALQWMLVPQQALITNFDIESVMMYPIRKGWVTGVKPREVPMKLSEGD
jgi:hypothetical protein